LEAERFCSCVHIDISDVVTVTSISYEQYESVGFKLGLAVKKWTAAVIGLQVDQGVWWDRNAWNRCSPHTFFTLSFVV